MVGKVRLLSWPLFLPWGTSSVPGWVSLPWPWRGYPHGPLRTGRPASPPKCSWAPREQRPLTKKTTPPRWLTTAGWELGNSSGMLGGPFPGVWVLTQAHHILAVWHWASYWIRGYLCHGLCSTEPLLRTSISLASQSNKYPKASHSLKN